MVNILDEGLFHTPVMGEEYVTRRFLEIARYAASGGANGLLFTCSAFGVAIDRARDMLNPLPVVAPNEALIEEAVATGKRVGLLTTFGPTLDRVPAEFPPGTLFGQALAPGAYAALNAGDVETHNRLVAECAERELHDCEVIALAQSSMAPAAAGVLAATGKPVLTSPIAAVAQLRRALRGGKAPSP